MQGNITVLDIQKFYDNSALIKGRKPAKLSTFNNVYKKTTELQNSVRPEKQELPEIPQTEVKQEVQTPSVETPAQQVIQQAPQQPENVINFPTKEVYQARLEALNTTCYSNLVGGNVLSSGHRRLKTNPVVPASLSETTNKAGIEYQMPVSEKVEEAKNEPIDFSSFPNVTKFPGTFVEHKSTHEKEISQPKVNDNVIKFPGTFGEPGYAYDKEKRLDTILSKELETPVTTPIDNTGVELEQVKKDYEVVAESLETQLEIQSELERELDEIKNQKIVQIAEYKQKTLEKTQNLHNVLARINQLKDAINEEKKALGMIDEDEYKKVSGL